MALVINRYMAGMQDGRCLKPNRLLNQYSKLISHLPGFS